MKRVSLKHAQKMDIDEIYYHLDKLKLYDAESMYTTKKQKKALDYMKNRVAEHKAKIEARKYKEKMDVYRESYRKIQRSIQIGCTHQVRNKLNVEFVSDDKVRCKICGKEFDVHAMSVSELKEAVCKVQDAINQIILFSDTRNCDDAFIHKLSEIDYDLFRIVETYKQFFR